MPLILTALSVKALTFVLLPDVRDVDRVVEERAGTQEDEEGADAKAVVDEEASNLLLTLSSALIILGLICAFFLPCLPAEPDEGIATCEVEGSEVAGGVTDELVIPAPTVSSSMRRGGGAFVVGVMRDP